MMLHRMSLLFVFILLLLTQCVAQQAASPAMTAFAAKDYATYLAGVPAELADAAQKPAGAFARLTAAAIALEKTAGWDGAAGTQVRDLNYVMSQGGGAFTLKQRRKFQQQLACHRSSENVPNMMG